MESKCIDKTVSELSSPPPKEKKKSETESESEDQFGQVVNDSSKDKADPPITD